MFKKLMSLFQKNSDSRPFVRDFVTVQTYEITADEMVELEILKSSLIERRAFNDTYCVI